MSHTLGNIVNRPILAVPVRLAAVAAFAVTLTDRRKGLPARADPLPCTEISAAGNSDLRARLCIFHAPLGFENRTKIGTKNR